MIIAAASAGYIGAPFAHGPAVVAAPAPIAVAHPAPFAVAHAAPIAVKALPVATSYANSNSISLGATPVVAAHAPVAVAHAAPVIAAPAYGLSFGHGAYH